VILLALDQYGSEHKAAEPLGMKRSSLRERIRCLGISRRGRSPTPPSVPQVP
jgi:hypothetical protein